MSKLWNFITSRFVEKARPRSIVPLIHEEYKIDYTDVEYINWKKSDALSFLKDSIHQAFIDTLTQQNYNKAIDFSMQNTYSGFRITPTEGIEKKSEFLYLQKYIAETTSTLGYFIQMSEIRTRENNGAIQTIYNIYMKPSHRFKIQLPADQRYGNTQIELSIVDDKIEYLRSKTMVYQDRNYKEPLAYAEWVNAVFNT